MLETNLKKEHILTLTDKEILSATGVLRIDYFSEETLIAYTEFGGIKISGSKLHVESLDASTAKLLVKGKIEGIVYFEKDSTKSILKRIFK